MNSSSKLFLIGPSGAGKTSIGRRLAEHFSLPFVDLDETIEQHTGVDIATIFDIEGEVGFRRRESMLLDAATREQDLVLATGAGAILTAENRQWIQQRGFVLWLDATIEQQLQRLSQNRQRPLLAGVNRRQRLADMATIRTPLYRDTADLRVATGNEPISQVVEHVLCALNPAWHPPLTRTP